LDPVVDVSVLVKVLEVILSQIKQLLIAMSIDDAILFQIEDNES
jgi:hypothetical protein